MIRKTIGAVRTGERVAGWLTDLALANERVVRVRLTVATVWASRGAGVHVGRTDNGDRAPGRVSVVPDEAIPSTARQIA